MKLTFYGAAQEVTGSCYMLTVHGVKILVDCGLPQGHDAKPEHLLSFDPATVDHVLMTHAHIDHCGLLPLLVKRGFKGNIHATAATCDLMRIMLLDSAQIQESDAAWTNRKGTRSGYKPVEPLFTTQDVHKTAGLFVPHEYEEIVPIASFLSFRMVDAGHLLGSASIEIWLEEEGEHCKIVFSGDIGNVNAPILRNPQLLQEADYVLMESTYGDRNHELSRDYAAEIATIFEETLGRGGNVIMPSFAVGRSQELLYIIREIKERHLVSSHPDFSVYLDSPMAIAATKIFERDLDGYADEATIALLHSGEDPLRFAGLRLCQSVEESRALNSDNEPKVIISTGGMCEGGRIRHHLKHNLWRQDSCVVFVGFQSLGTLGRRLVDGARQIDLFGEEIAVRATVHNFKRLSSHADRSGLQEWIGAFTTKPRGVFIVHGESLVAQSFASDLVDLGYTAHAPNYGEVVDLINGTVLEQGTTKATTVAMASTAAWAKLQVAVDQLKDLVALKQGAPNIELNRLTNQIQSLLQKWRK
ncbi:MAG: MBL fold metallo-hydrolase [Symbiobacteriaceae bacterium]|nr:MBL fold metallo-hydrolase [Symbiobacteriaceae bacterium]